MWKKRTFYRLLLVCKHAFLRGGWDNYSIKISCSHVWSQVFILILLSPQPDRTYDLKIGQPTVSYFLKQAAGIAKGAGKTGEMCACTDLSALTPIFTHWAFPVTDTRLSRGSVLSFAVIDVIFMTCGGSAAEEGSGKGGVLRKENYGFLPFMLQAISSLVSAVDS